MLDDCAKVCQEDPSPQNKRLRRPAEEKPLLPGCQMEKTKIELPLDKKSMVTRHPSAIDNGSIVEETRRALLSRRPNLRGALEFLFQDARANLSFESLRIQPVVAAHRNLVAAEPFLLPKERFAGAQDVALVSLVRTVVDETLRAFASTSPQAWSAWEKRPSPRTAAWA